MAFETDAEIFAAGLVVAFLATRELWRRFRLRYEYRWESFAVRGPRGGQLLHIRRSEIQSIEPLSIKDRIDRFGRFKRLTRSSLGRQVVIHSTVPKARPVVVSWEGRPIAGVTPVGYKVRSGDAGREG